MRVEGKCNMLYCTKDLIHQCFVPLPSLYFAAPFTVLGGYLSILLHIICNFSSPLIFHISIPSNIPDSQVSLWVGNHHLKLCKIQVNGNKVTQLTYSCIFITDL